MVLCGSRWGLLVVLCGSNFKILTILCDSASRLLVSLCIFLFFHYFEHLVAVEFEFVQHFNSLSLMCKIKFNLGFVFEFDVLHQSHLRCLLQLCVFAPSTFFSTELHLFLLQLHIFAPMYFFVSLHFCVLSPTQFCFCSNSIFRVSN